MSKKTDPVMTFDDVAKKTEQFGDLLGSIESLEDKKKHLWKEIYENAIVDRMNAYMLFTDVYSCMTGDKADHVTLGPMMAKYIERMNKANDQLLKLAELIAKEEEKAAQIDPDNLFAQISGQKMADDAKTKADEANGKEENPDEVLTTGDPTQVQDVGVDTVSVSPQAVS